MTTAREFFAQDSCEKTPSSSVVSHFRHSGLVEHFDVAARIAPQSAAEVEDGMMIAFVPPHEIADQLAVHGTEPVGQLHITLAYLGKTTGYQPEQLANLPDLVASWARRQRPVKVRIGGVGKFTNADQHVLWAAADIPGGTHLHSNLEQFLNGNGYRTPSEHGWNPHLTLAYVGPHFRFLPKVPEVQWTADRVFVCIAGAWTPVILGAAPTEIH